MSIDAFIPPILEPYKQWIALALFVLVYLVRPSMPAPKANSPTVYVFVFNLLDRISGSYGNAAYTHDNVPVTAPVARVAPPAGPAAPAPAAAAAPAAG